ncbi:MAG TPA: RagB/SusD family nutrient uptake outer membrane protein [Puia sp.]|uniref:RagB/SusD family nutrient uptake outer membrane protein n=1 Tax=Puia sp. TaxID=2045100 RepID=UPI002BE77BA5|nr:RagB/SusD family nutrient uptake outer membrane protein [Puia sp.]HVU95760.1 RagB/SusD family nutrient uptake outer membrane protein [Puia sp.]
MSQLLKSINLLWLIPALWMLGIACHKQDFLNKKPSTTLVVPTTLSDFQALMDNVKVFGLVPTLGEASADNYFVSYPAWLILPTREHNAYIWAKDIYGGQGEQQDWNVPYQQVYYANVVLEGIKKMKLAPDSVAQWKAIEGAALFCRAFAFYNLAQLFAPIYDSTTASTDLGIPIRTSSLVDTLSARSSVQVTYDQILNDLHNAEAFLPTDLPGKVLNRPTEVTAQALLARVYLSMRNYTKARLCADSVLQVYSTLMDYSDLAVTTPVPINMLNPETLYQASFLGGPNTVAYFSSISANYPTTWIDTGLIKSYDSNDLRRITFYRSRPSDTTSLRFGYTGMAYPFGGLAVDELFLIRAEGAAKAGDALAAINDINILLRSRWKPGTFTDYTVASVGNVLELVRTERRKELAFRGLRWTDLRRLNKEGANITLTRVLVDSAQNTKRYTLAPNNLNYTLPIPPDVISLNGAIQQNPRNQ